MNFKNYFLEIFFPDRFENFRASNLLKLTSMRYAPIFCVAIFIRIWNLAFEVESVFYKVFIFLLICIVLFILCVFFELCITLFFKICMRCRNEHLQD